MFQPYQDLLDGKPGYQGEIAEYLPDPIAVGAVGGSGTRVIAQILADTGITMSTPKNQSNDALEWPPMRALMNNPELAGIPLTLRYRQAFNGLEKLLHLKRHQEGNSDGRAGWKVPGTHIWLEQLAAFFPQMQYIHIMRNGLDMAYSDNQQQLKLWGSLYGVEASSSLDEKASPEDALEYWLRANEKVLEFGRATLGDRLHIIRFEELCTAPQATVASMLSFLQMDATIEETHRLSSGIRRPATIDRYLSNDWQSTFSKQQLARVEALGYLPGKHNA
ncbi:sulfotransferase [Halioglobus maricola]|uniref:Sulfotransferase n=1 Tax=Halioglobus maricola TaxID=2601894 RepID=A0A5P9NG30_9GAMM|nr:sulfotransferase [Halioglobus maricola]QFU74767.1 sulfotransferase [Halioglobus maricola]